MSVSANPNHLHPSAWDAANRARALLAELPLLGHKIEMAARISGTGAEALLVETLRFLSLCAWSDLTLSPSRPVDLAWHELILFTRAYRAFCDRHFGRFIHHHPGGSEKENAAQFRRTVKLYTAFFGPPPTRFWGEVSGLAAAGTCGSCGGGPAAGP